MFDVQILNHNTGSGYDAPEVPLSGQYTFKSDVYSFGVVMLELLTGRKPFDRWTIDIPLTIFFSVLDTHTCTQLCWHSFKHSLYFEPFLGWKPETIGETTISTSVSFVFWSCERNNNLNIFLIVKTSFSQLKAKVWAIFGSVGNSSTAWYWCIG